MLNKIEKEIQSLVDEQDNIINKTSDYYAGRFACSISALLLLFIIFVSGFNFLLDLIFLVIFFGAVAFVCFQKEKFLHKKLIKIEDELTNKKNLKTKINNLKILDVKSRRSIKYLSDLYLMLCEKDDVYIDEYYLTKVKLFLELIDSVDYNLMEQETTKKADEILAEIHILTADYYNSILNTKKNMDKLKVDLVHKSIGVEPFRIEQLQLTGETPVKELLALPSLGDEELRYYSQAYYQVYGNFRKEHN